MSDGDSGEQALTVPRTIVLVGLMGAGKSAVGRRSAQRLGLDFVDADTEIEAAAGCAISDFFELHGEEKFRDGERRVIARLLDGETKILATGGGAFMDPETRQRIAERGISVWLKADLDTLVARTSRRNHRPLLRNGDPRKILKSLMAERYPVYAEADITVETGEAPVNRTVDLVLSALRSYLAGGRSAAAKAGEQ